MALTAGGGAARPDPGRRPVAALFAVLILALALRLWGLSFGLPASFSGDEIEKRDTALHLGETGLAAPQPGFLYNTLFLIYRAAGTLAPRLDLLDYHYLGRLWMAVLGVLTVLAVWRLGVELSAERRPYAGLAAALFLAVLPLHSTVSRYIKEDAPLGLLVALVVLALVRYWKAPSRGRLALLGLALGVCGSTKFTGGILLPVVGVGVVLTVRRQTSAAGPLAGALALLLGTATLGFFAASPQYLREPGQLLESVAYQTAYSARGHDGVAISPWTEWWTYYIRQGLIPGMTWPVFLLALAGLGLLVRRPAGWFVTATVLLLYLLLEQSPAKPAPFAARYLTPVVPLLCVAAGLAAQRVIERGARLVARPLLLGGVGLLFVVPPLLKSAMIADEAVHDTRILAGAWMDRELPAGVRIVIAEDWTNLPVADGWTGAWTVDQREGTLDPSPGGPPAPYFVVSSFKYQRFLDAPDAVPARTAYYARVMEYPLVREFRPRWLTYGKHSPVIRIHRPAGSPAGQSP
jgi:hypothetical protein